MGEKPNLTGQVTTYNQNKIGSIALWENEKENDRQPDYTGSVSFYNGKKKFKIALWNNEEDEMEKVEVIRDTIPDFSNPEK